MLNGENVDSYVEVEKVSEKRREITWYKDNEDGTREILFSTADTIER